MGLLTLISAPDRLVAPPCLPSEPHTDFVKMTQEVSRVLVDAVGTGAFQFLLPVASRQEADSNRPCPAGGEHVPDAVPHHDAPVNRYVEMLRRGDEHIRIRFGVADLVPRHNRDTCVECEEFEGLARAFHQPAGGNRDRHKVP